VGPLQQGIVQQGIVTWFNDGRGFGFIVRRQGRDVFFHIKRVISDELMIDQPVEFKVRETHKGLEVFDVRGIE